MSSDHVNKKFNYFFVEVQNTVMPVPGSWNNGDFQPIGGQMIVFIFISEKGVIDSKTGTYRGNHAGKKEF